MRSSPSPAENAAAAACEPDRCRAFPPPRVTIGVPVYKRLDLLPRCLRSVEAQTYPNVELLVSDNGQNGSSLDDLVAARYGRPFRIRRNDDTVPVIRHFNQIVAEASGEYFVILCDDDEVSPNFVEVLLARMEESPRPAVAIARNELMDESGGTLPSRGGTLASRLPGAAFVRRWGEGTAGCGCLITNLARTDDLRSCGMFPEFARGYHSDNALFLKLCLLGDVAFCGEATFRWQVDPSSLGWSARYPELAEASRQFLAFLERDPFLLRYARQHPREWRGIRRDMVRMIWRTYFHRWKSLRAGGADRGTFLRAAVAFPWNAAYYAAAGRVLLRVGARSVRRRVRRASPAAPAPGDGA